MNPDPDQMSAALCLIGTDCTNYTRGLCSDEPNRSPYVQYTADRWCDPCIARAGLAGTLPDPPPPAVVRVDDPAWVAGVRWAASEADAQAAGREPVYILDITDHLRACADNPNRKTAVAR